MPDDRHRVVFVTQMFPPETGGNASRIYDTATNLGEDWAVTVLSPPPTVPIGAFERSRSRATTDTVEGVTVHRLWTWQPTVENPGMARRLPYYIIFALHAMLWLLWHRRRYDAVVTTTPPISTGGPGLLAGLLGVPWIVDVRDLWIDASISLGYLEAGGAVERVSRRFQRLVLASADRITVTTETLAAALTAEYGEDLERKIVEFPNGVDTHKFRPRTVRDPAAGTIAPPDAVGNVGRIVGDQPDSGSEPPRTVDALGERDGDDDRHTIVYTGNLGTAQDLEACVRAMAFVSTNSVLRLVGGGDVESDLRHLADEFDVADRVRFDDPVPRESVPDVLNQATIGVAPLAETETLSYAMPTKTYEYLACALPTVVTGSGEIEAFADRSGGAVNVLNNPECLAAIFDDLIEDPERRGRMARAGRKYVVDHHDRAMLADRLRDELATLVNGNGVD